LVWGEFIWNVELSIISSFFEDASIIVALAIPLRFDAVVANWSFLSAFDSASSTGCDVKD
jgi:hypothetical protein